MESTDEPETSSRPMMTTNAHDLSTIQANDQPINDIDVAAMESGGGNGGSFIALNIFSDQEAEGFCKKIARPNCSTVIVPGQLNPLISCLLPCGCGVNEGKWRFVTPLI